MFIQVILEENENIEGRKEIGKERWRKNIEGGKEGYFLFLIT